IAPFLMQSIWLRGEMPLLIANRLSQDFPILRSSAKCLILKAGRVAEWFKAPVLKTGVGASPPWVRIPPLPPNTAECTLWRDIAADHRIPPGEIDNRRFYATVRYIVSAAIAV